MKAQVKAREVDTSKLLDCGHMAKLEPFGIGTGYAHDAQERTLCYACCAEGDRKLMRETGAHSGLYLTRRADEGYAFTVSNWPGTLRFAAYGIRQSARGGGFGSKRVDAWFAGPDGYEWHAVQRGNMDLCRCKRTKVRLASSARTEGGQP